MNIKTKKIINLGLTAVIGLIFIGSAISKLMGGEEATKMTQDIGLSPSELTMVGIIELISVILFIIPRTGILGTLLLAAYMGGAIATHLTHGQSIIAPSIIQALIWIVAIIRFSELKIRLFNDQIPNTASHP
jgi:uncharacterized membrane protein YphA (DoxX/SURF4 family)